MKPSTARALHLLRSADGWISGNAIAAVAGYRFGGRLHELRHDYGYAIERRSASNGSHVDEYRLVPEPEQLALELAS